MRQMLVNITVAFRQLAEQMRRITEVAVDFTLVVLILISELLQLRFQLLDTRFIRFHEFEQDTSHEGVWCRGICYNICRCGKIKIILNYINTIDRF